MSGYSYNGVAASADFSTPANIILDGEPWQFGDPTSGAGGHFDVTKKLLDRVAWLKAHGGWTDIESTWTAEQHFTGGIEVQSTLHLGSSHTMTADGTINVTSSGSLICGSGATVQFVGDVEVDGALKLTGDGAVTRKRILGLGNIDSSFPIDKWDIVHNTAPITGSNKTMTISPPASGLPCSVFIEFFVDPGSPGRTFPSLFGGSASDHSINIVAGTGAAQSTATMSFSAGPVVSCWVHYTAAGNFWISAFAVGG